MGVSHLLDFDLFDEPLTVSMKRYHSIYGQNNMEDPLIQYRAKGGIMARRSQEESNLVHNILICWTYPHIQMFWNQLVEYIDEVVQVKITNEVISSYVPIQTE
jgi:hypothetical protein